MGTTPSQQRHARVPELSDDSALEIGEKVLPFEIEGHEAVSLPGADGYRYSLDTPGLSGPPVYAYGLRGGDLSFFFVLVDIGDHRRVMDTVRISSFESGK